MCLSDNGLYAFSEKSQKQGKIETIFSRKYYLIYPTDYQAYEKSKTAKNEYDAMWKEVKNHRKEFLLFYKDRVSK